MTADLTQQISRARVMTEVRAFPTTDGQRTRYLVPLKEYEALLAVAAAAEHLIGSEWDPGKPYFVTLHKALARLAAALEGVQDV